jgi:hypothetical protein
VLLWDYSVPGDNQFHGLYDEYHLPVLGNGVAYSAGGLVWAVSSRRGSNRSTELFCAKIPHADALEVAGKLPSGDDLRVMRPGDAVTIQMELDPDIGSTDEVRAAIAANLKEAGLLVTDDSDSVLIATCKRQPTQTIKINTAPRHFGPGWWRPPRPEDIVEKSITPCLSTLTLKYRGAVLWNRGGLATPGSAFTLAEGETLDQYLERATKPNLKLLKETKFKGYFAQPGDATPEGAYGTSPLPVNMTAGSSK